MMIQRAQTVSDSESDQTFRYSWWFVGIFALIALLFSSLAACSWQSGLPQGLLISITVIAFICVFLVAKQLRYHLTLAKDCISVHGIFGLRLSRPYSDIETIVKDDYGTMAFFFRGWSQLAARV